MIKLNFVGWQRMRGRVARASIVQALSKYVVFGTFYGLNQAASNRLIDKSAQGSSLTTMKKLKKAKNSPVPAHVMKRLMETNPKAAAYLLRSVTKTHLKKTT